jgi:hypothetical protein
MKRMLLILAPLALAACASTTSPSTQDATVAAADNGTICDRETSTGTILPTKRCRTAEQREAERRAVESVESNTRNIRAGQTGKPGS